MPMKADVSGCKDIYDVCVTKFKKANRYNGMQDPHGKEVL